MVKEQSHSINPSAIGLPSMTLIPLATFFLVVGILCCFAKELLMKFPDAPESIIAIVMMFDGHSIVIGTLSWSAYSVEHKYNLLSNKFRF